MPLTGYTSTLTLAQASTVLASRLNDPSFIYWSNTELNTYIVESLRMFQAMSLFYRDRGLIQLLPGQSFYTLDSSLVSPSETQFTATPPFASSVTDQSLITAIQTALLEPLNATAWTGTAQFTYNQVSSSLQRTLNRFLLQTGIVQWHAILPVSSPEEPTFSIPQTIIDIRRAAWQDATSLQWQTLWRADPWVTTSYLPNAWANPGLPVMYSTANLPPFQMQVIPPPINSGNLDVIAVSNGAILTPNATPTVLGIPDDWTWVLKWGVLAELLNSDGPSRDPVRAQFCLQFYNSAIALARLYPSVTAVQLGNIPIPVSTLDELDKYAASWQSQTGPVTSAAMAGRNLLIAAPIPNQACALTVDFIRVMPVPVAPDDFLQIPDEQMETILACAQFLACFKMGGAEFNAATVYFQDFLNFIAIQNAKLRATSLYKMITDQLSTNQEIEVPRQVTGITNTNSGNSWPTGQTNENSN